MQKMVLKSWKWLKNEFTSHRRKSSPSPMEAVHYDPDANRKEYQKAFDEFKQRGINFYRPTHQEDIIENLVQSRICTVHKKETVESQNEDPNNNQVVDMTIIDKSRKIQQPDSNNKIDFNEIEFADNYCMEKFIYGGNGESPPRNFYRDNSNPFPDVITETAKYTPLVQQGLNKVEKSRKPFNKILKVIKSGSDKLFDFRSPLSDDEKIEKKMEKSDETVECAILHSQRNAGAELQSPIKNINVVEITDLDETSKNASVIKEDISAILYDSYSLTEDLEDSSLLRSPPYAKSCNHIIQCNREEIMLQKPNPLRNTIDAPLQFLSATFRRTNVTLKKCCPREDDSALEVLAIQTAIERDYEILSKVKQSNIVILMAACFDKKFIDRMLLLEPVDYTLNYYLHHMNKELSLEESRSVVKQVANGVLYLQDCGYIHSNISSHNVLVRENPFNVKLSSFELATDVDCSEARSVLQVFNEWNKNESEMGTSHDKNTSTKKQCRETSKLSTFSKCSGKAEFAKYVMYAVSHRYKYTLYNYQAPEVLTTTLDFVYPTIKTDAYSLCLLLWEVLNKRVPFEKYSEEEMVKMFVSNVLHLTYDYERCNPFMNIFCVGLAINPDKRICVQELIELLENVKLNECNSTETEEDIPVNVSESLMSVSPGFLKFNKSLKERAKTSTMKKVKKPSRKSGGDSILNCFNVEPIDYKKSDSQVVENIDAINFEGFSGPDLSEGTKMATEKPKSSFVTDVVGFSVKNKTLNNTRSTENSPSPATGARRKLFNSSPITAENYAGRPKTTPDQNRNNRNGPLNMTLDNDTGSKTNKLNVSIRIVHNKITPTKSDLVSPSVTSIIKFFNSGKTTPQKDLPSFYDKSSITPTRINDKLPNGSESHLANLLNGGISVAASGKPNYIEQKSFDKAIEDFKTKTPLNQKNYLFTHQLWKREMDICNKSSNSTVNHCKVAIPKLQNSVRDKITKFEHINKTISSKTIPTESLNYAGCQQNSRKPFYREH